MIGLFLVPDFDQFRSKGGLMRALFCATSVLVLLLIAGLVSGPAGAQDEEKTPPVKKIMDVLHKGGKAHLSKAKAALKGDSPDWAEVLKDAKAIAKYGAYLPKNDPPRGDKESWEKIAKTYASTAKTLEEAAEKEELTKARAATKKLGATCKTCHEAHKPAD
jgi:cytochrome c556